MTNARKMSTTVVTADNSHDTATVVTSMPPASTQTDTAVAYTVRDTAVQRIARVCGLTDAVMPDAAIDIAALGPFRIQVHGH